MKIGIIFPGQGSQYAGMAADFIETAEAKHILKTAEQITRLPLKKLCLQGPEEQLVRTLICQPAVLAADLICWEALRPHLRGTFALAGHSLGEYAALVAAGVLSVVDAFRLVSVRARAMEEQSCQTQGGMLAIIGRSLEEVRQLTGNFAGIEISNINAPSQIVVGGPSTAIELLETYLREQKIKAIRLKVSGSFHTSLMKPVAGLLEKELSSVSLKPFQYPVFLNFTGRKATGLEEIRKAIVQQSYSPVRWVEIVQAMAEDGVNLFIEVGPKTVLSGLVAKILPGICVWHVEDRKSLEIIREKIQDFVV